MSLPFQITREQITGLVLAGGQGRRMGGQDKGLLPFNAAPGAPTLAQHALARLAPQVGVLALSANRHLDRYAAYGVPVWPDAQADFPGPLAGMLAGLSRAGTPWLATVPCDSPGFPPDLVARLARAAGQAGAVAAMAVTLHEGERRTQPVFALLHRGLAADLAQRLALGERRLQQWLRAQAAVEVVFEDAAAFANLNSPEDLAQQQQQGPRG